MSLQQTLYKIKGVLFLLVSSVGVGLLTTSTAFADIPSPTDKPYISRCRPYPGSICTEHIMWDRFFVTVGYFFVGTLILELPVFFLFGFRTKKKLGLAVLANVISVPAYHLINALFSGTNVLVAEACITIFECLFLIFFLRKEMSVTKIIIATIVANAVSFLLGMILIQSIFPTFFYSY